MYTYIPVFTQYIQICTQYVPRYICDGQACARHCLGSVCLDSNLLKPSRIEFVDKPAPLLAMSDTQASPPQWLEHIYRTAHPALCWLPTKLAEWIWENLQDQLGFLDKADQRAEPGTGWTPAELNHILHAHVVDSAFTTFGCVEWESQLFRGTQATHARCSSYPSPFNLRFHFFNPKVRTCINHMNKTASCAAQQ